MPVLNPRTQYRNKNPLPPESKTKGKTSFDRDYSFIFSDELPVSKKRAVSKKEFIVVDGIKVEVENG